jgi:molybdopterin synthase sulfur carrier subunit
MSDTMQLHLLYFARLREAVGRSGETVQVPPAVTNLGQLRAWLIARGEPWEQAFARVQPVRIALDQVLGRDDTPLHGGAEVAFFPPVTGG